MKIPHPVARILASLAERAASDIGIPMAIAVADAEGGLQCFSRMDGALPASTEIAVSKAFSAAVLRMGTHELGRLAAPGKELYGIQHTHGGRIILFGGGLPLKLKGVVAGGIGVSGGSVDEDMLAAGIAVDALKEMEEWAGKIAPLLPEKLSGTESLSRLHRGLPEAFQLTGAPVSYEFRALLSGALLLAAGGEVQ
jgi:uncharacterized protein GlcG (DUF336 family)